MAEQHAVAPGHADSAAPEATFRKPCQGGLLDPDARLDRRRLRRHRHEPALRHARDDRGRTGGRQASPVPDAASIVLGVLSLILWSLILVVTVKYVVLLLRADNKGEGGTLTLVALAQRALGSDGASVLLLGIAGAGLFYGDAVITPAISVLSAVEGLKLVDARPSSDYVVPITLVDPGRPVRGPEPRHRQGRGLLRPDHARSGSSPWRVLGLLHIADDPASCSAHQPVLRRAVLRQPSRRVARGARRGLPGGHRRRGALRRYRPFRPRPDPHRLARLRLPGARPQLFRPGRARARRSRRRSSNPFFRLAPDWAAAAAVVLLATARDHHREPGGDHRRLLADPAGDPARPPAAPRDPLHLGDRTRARSTCRGSTGCCSSA